MGARVEKDVLTAFSLEITSRDAVQLAQLSASIPRGTLVSVPYLANETDADRILAARTVRQAEYEPMPHIAARRVRSHNELSALVSNLVHEARVDRLLLIAGDLDPPAGPFADTISILRSGVLQHHGIRHVSVAGHPEGHPVQDKATLHRVMSEKRDILDAMNVEWSIFTQFAFGAEPVLEWIGSIRRLGIGVPIHVGIPGPASVKTLLKFAAVCGVSASTAVFKKYGLSITQLLSSAGPDTLVRDYAVALADTAYGDVRLHFYPFGGIHKTADWLTRYGRA